MAVWREAELKKHLAEGTFRPVYFLFGREHYLIQSYLRKLIRAVLGADASDFNLTRLDGGETTVQAISDALEALPVFASHRVVVVEDLDLNKLAASETAKLKELLSDLPETGVLIFVTRALEVTGKSRDKFAAFIKQIDKAGAACEFERLDKPALVRYLRDRLARHGVPIKPEVAGYLVDRVSPEMGVIRAESDKLIYLGREATRQDVERICPAGLEVSVFDLGRLIVRRDYRGTMAKLADLFEAREEPVAVWTILAGTFVDLYRAKTAGIARLPAERVVADFGYKATAFRVKNAMRDAGRFTLPQLRVILAILADCDRALKSAPADSRVLMEEAITKIFAAMSPAGTPF